MVIEKNNKEALSEKWKQMATTAIEFCTRSHFSVHLSHYTLTLLWANLTTRLTGGRLSYTLWIAWSTTHRLKKNCMRMWKELSRKSFFFILCNNNVSTFAIIVYLILRKLTFKWNSCWKLKIAGSHKVSQVNGPLFLKTSRRRRRRDSCH